MCMRETFSFLIITTNKIVGLRMMNFDVVFKSLILRLIIIYRHLILSRKTFNSVSLIVFRPSSLVFCLVNIFLHVSFEKTVCFILFVYT